MSKIEWDKVGERRYETGVDRGVLYTPNSNGEYDSGVAWNGLTTVTESPSGAESNPQYADNIKYLNLISAEEFGATIEAFTYPAEFEEFDGIGSLAAGVKVGQQSRRSFGFAFRTLVGNDVDGSDHGYKIHLVYGAQAAPSEKANNTVNDSPEAVAFSWEVSTTPVSVPGLKPSSHLIIDSTEVDEDALGILEDILYGAPGEDPRLPLPSEILGLFTGSVSVVRLTGSNAPTYNAGTHVVTLPAVTGVQWKINGVNKSPGAQPALTPGQVAVVTAVANNGYTVTGDDDWAYDY